MHINFLRPMKKIFILLIAMTMALVSRAENTMLRGVVYDCGLMFNGKNLSVEDFNPKQVAYDMDVIRHILQCNSVRVEGEDLERLRTASKLAKEQGLQVYFNPWKHAAGPEETIMYMTKAARVAEELRQEGVNIVFVAGCEYSLFSQGAVPGDTFDEHIAWLMSLGKLQPQEAMTQLGDMNKKLNAILSKIVTGVRKVFKGKVSYSSGTWEQVDWNLFDIVGIDYYRNGESSEAYTGGLERYKQTGKPVVCMEMGCCAYKGAAPRGGFGFSVLQGIDADGHGIYQGGVTPVRDEKEQADYIEEQVTLLHQAGIDGVFVYVFRYPIAPYRTNGCDQDMTAYALVKSFPSESPQSKMIPCWEPKQAFYRLGEIFTHLAARSSADLFR